MSSDSEFRFPRWDAGSAGNMQSQLVALYEEKRRLFEELGIADADEIISMIRSLEAQLVDLYAKLDEREE